MSSGTAKTHLWVLEHVAESARSVDPLMGWTSSDDTRSQLKLWFASKDEAIEYAKSKALVYTVEEPQERKMKPKVYSDNFANDRLLRWTH